MIALLAQYRLWLGAIAALLALLGVQTYRVQTAQKETAAVTLEFSTARLAAQAETLRVANLYRAEEQRRTLAQKETIDVANKTVAAARADAVLAGNAADRLRKREAALIASARAATGNPVAAGASAPAGDTFDLLANMRSRIDAAAGLFASVADERGAAGAACVRSYESLTP